MEKLRELIENTGGRIVESRVFEPKLPHYLAYIPRRYVEKIRDEAKRKDLLRRWDKAYEKWKNGAEHPPVACFLVK
ncbi:hypothetical protein Pyrde_0296 [Pyrodictium delaneyi]|uniref:Uncharacterized protein n=1 Tax=Pyrodictium delaneyi TaxID=1273541 RepID=A0A0P0N230_9CREN|nr:hypothetical protein [Pyrodictium delaneyi]ALL00346.1 hypothetical protein Pyrde_0296 [Pyrodictium delaneyi]